MDSLYLQGNVSSPLLAAPLFAAMLIASAGAATIHVNDNAAGDPVAGNCLVSDPLEDGTAAHPFDGIQEGLAAALSGDTVMVAAGLYTGPCNRQLDFAGKAILLSGAGCGACVIDAGGVARAFIFDNNEPATAKVTGFTITDGHGANGGAVLCSPGSPTFEMCCLVDNLADFSGGAVAAFPGSHPSFLTCTFVENNANNRGGAIFVNGGDVTLVDASFTDNAAADGGAVFLFNGATAVMTDCSLSGNSATGQGGGFYGDDATSLDANETEFNGNHADGSGGSLFFSDGASGDLFDCTVGSSTAVALGGGACAMFGSELRIEQCLLVGNAAEEGGALAITEAAQLEMLTTNVTQNTAALRGGGLFADAPGKLLSLTECSFVGNHANTGSGGGITALESQLSVLGCSLRGNISQFTGGGMFTEASNGTIVETTFDINDTLHRGGGLFCAFSTLALSQCDFDENRALSGADGRGGGVSSESSEISLSECKLLFNEALQGGGMESHLGGVSVSYCLFEENLASSGAGAFHSGELGIPQPSKYWWTRFVANDGTGEGGGIYFEDAQSTLHNCGFFGNEATDCGGGIAARLGSVIDVVGSLFTCNHVVMGGGPGGAMCIRQGSLVNVINCSLSSNHAVSANGGGLYLDLGSSVDIDSSILWANYDGTGFTFEAQIYLDPGSGSTAVLDYSDIMNFPACPSDGNICLNPLFADADGADNICGTVDDNLTLAPGSPCIDAGDNNMVHPDLFDLDADGDTIELLPQDIIGMPRFQDDPATLDTGLVHLVPLFAALPIIDMGALEFPGAVIPCPTDLNGDGKTDGGDLGLMLAAWGPCDDCDDCPEDLNGDCIVDGADFGLALGAWGDCP